MKKLFFSAFCVAAMAAAPISAQETTYVEDCSQGLLLNKNKDNWFITARGGANFKMGKYDIHARLRNRVGGNASLFVGKWITPTVGVRFGFDMKLTKGATIANGTYRDYAHSEFANGYYPEKSYNWGIEIDGMINMTNWICGYKPNRVYNGILYGGVGSMWALRHAETSKKDFDWQYSFHNRVLFVNIGYENHFRISDAFDVLLGVQFDAIDWPQIDYLASVNAGITYNFKKRDWNCPVTAVCPTWKYTDAEGDALTARLATADGKIRDLQRQLNDCLNRPAAEAKVVEDCDQLATVYYPINVSTLGMREKGVLTSVAQVMKDSPDQKYILTGWADNYTGTNDINVNLRHARVNGVKNFLIKCGVNPDQLDVNIDNGELTDFGVKSASLDRAVTIKEAK